MDATRLSYWLALIRMKGVGSATFEKITRQFGDPAELFNLSESDLGSYGVSAALIDQLNQWRRPGSLLQTQVAADLAWLEQGSQRFIVTWADPTYPPQLRACRGAPPVLFGVGELSCLGMAQVAMVGSRHCSARGSQLAESWAAALSQAGMAITSGLALGVDGAAHRGTLKAGGRTIAVLAHGLDQIYPERHRRLAADIVQQGACISEFPPGTDPKPAHFPRRNRIISGLSRGVLVVEAARRSGSLITAREAAAQGREVMALPGVPGNPLAAGCHELIREGATLVDQWQQVTEQLGWDGSADPNSAGLYAPSQYGSSQRPTNGRLQQPNEPQQTFTLEDPLATRILSAIQCEALNTDQLVACTGSGIVDILSALTLLELEGRILQEQGAWTPA